MTSKRERARVRARVRLREKVCACVCVCVSVCARVCVQGERCGSLRGWHRSTKAQGWWLKGGFFEHTEVNVHVSPLGSLMQ